MTRRNEIIEELARCRVVEQMCMRVAKAPLRNGIDDLAQMVYLALLTYDEAKIVAMYDNGELNFFVARIVMNQYNSRHSPFYRQQKEFRERLIDDEESDINNI